MKIYISGISGTAMGALAIFAKKAGIEVFGSDQKEGAVSQELRENGIDFKVGEQDGIFLQEKFSEEGIDWFIYTSALPEDHAELKLAKELGIKVSKRDELINFLAEKLNLKIVAIAGTHGKTTTTAMIIWTCLQLGLPISWLEGTTLGFAPAGNYDSESKFLIYEADEYDKNFLAFHPWLSIITVVDYDHADIYPTVEDYQKAFEQFESQSQQVIKNAEIDTRIELTGEVRKKDASLALQAVLRILEELVVEKPVEKIISLLNSFPGANRRFEKIAENVYSDYAHHPEEIRTTIEVAQEEKEKVGAEGIVVVYEPHQNARQHEVKKQYVDCFLGVDKIFWLPTFLTREDPELKALSPEELTENLKNKESVSIVENSQDLYEQLKKYQAENYLILLLSAGPADEWFRKLFGNI